MYSVEDLLISHGYKLPQHSSSSVSVSGPPPAQGPAPPPRTAPSPLPPSYSKRGGGAAPEPGRPAGPHWTANGYERGAGPAGGDLQQPPGGRLGCPNNNNNEAPRDKGPPRQDGEGQGHGDSRSESLTSDSGFCEGPRGAQPQSKDLAYWRRRGQDFTVLMDYADFREHHGGGGGGGGGPAGHCRAEPPQQQQQQPRGQEAGGGGGGGDERQRAAQERQRWAAQAQARAREREAALHRWRLANERKCQSLGTEEWRPAVGFGRQLSESEAERWAHEQQRLHARTPDGLGAVHPRTKAKSQSLPRMLPPPDGPQPYGDAAPAGQEPHRRVNGHPPSPHDFYRGPARWPENGRPASANQLSMTPKARFTRPPRPPSYEVHQQIRGSCEVLSGRDSVLSQGRDRTPLPLSRAGDPQLDYFAQDSGPPGYIPPPSYKRAPLLRGGRRGYGEIFVDYRYRGDVYQQMQMAPDGSHWFSRHPAGSWPDPPRERGAPVQRQLYPVYASQQQHPGGGVQYIPFDDPRVRHISSALGGNSLTDADKIRHIRNELPGVAAAAAVASERCPDDSAFLPPPLGPFVAPARPRQGSRHAAPLALDNDNANDNRWRGDLHKETVDNFPATDQNCNNRYPKGQRPPPSPSAVFQVSALTACSSRQGAGPGHAFTETVTQVKKIVPDSDANRNSKRRVSETIFCLVSVPIHTPVNMNKEAAVAADQNNNETIPRLTITNTDSVTVRHSENHNLRSQSVNEMPIRSHHAHFHTSSTSSLRNYKRAPLRKEIIDAWALQANEDKELCYAGSWPGNQYRNQETQTTSPLTVAKIPDPQGSPPDGQPPCRVSSDAAAAAESGAGADGSGTCYGYPLAGQKDLHPSSNSAFSRLSLTLGQPPSPPPSHPAPRSPPAEPKEPAARPPASPRRNGGLPLDAAAQVAFGQFLLKPVDRRPWDAIGELECINKELEITVHKRPPAERCSVSLDDVHKHTSAHPRTKSHPPPSLRAAECQPPTSHSGRESISLPPTQRHNPNGVRIRSESCGPTTTERDFREGRSAFSRPQSARDHAGPHQPPSPAYRQQDIPVPQESLLRDVGLTVYTETPGGPGEPVLRSLSSPAPLHPHRDVAQPAQENRPALAQNYSVSKHNSDKELWAEEETERKAKENLPQPRGERSVRMYRARSESGRSPSGRWVQGSPRSVRPTGEATRSFDDDVFDDGFVVAEPLTYRNECTLTDRHLENLLIREKARNALPSVDLSKLYEVKSAKGIPENESMEQRAARILGISVPVEALGVGDGPEEDSEETPRRAAEDLEASSAEVEMRGARGETKQVAEQREEADEPVPRVLQEWAETAAGREMGGADTELLEQRSAQEPDEDPGSCVDPCSVAQQQAPGDRSNPEFPPTKLALSLPAAAVEKPTTCGGERRNRGAASKLIESLQDKLSSSASASPTPSSRSATERMARLKELDSVSRIRRLSLKSGGETGRETGGETGRETGGEIARETGGETGREIGGEIARETGGETGRQTGRETGGETGRETGRQTGRETGGETARETGGETGPEERDGDPEGDGEKAELKRYATERRQEEETGKDVLVCGAENVHETHNLYMDPKDVEKETVSHESEQREEHVAELQIKIEHAEVEQHVHIEEQRPEECADGELQINIEERTREEHAAVELHINIEEKAREEHAEAELHINDGGLKREIALRADGSDAAVQSPSREGAEGRPAGGGEEEPRGAAPAAAVEGGGHARQGMRPKPRQRTGRPQKPPLMPKPRSVPKREITLPLGLSTVTSDLEDEGPRAVSDSYDPSRVERV